MPNSQDQTPNEKKQINYRFVFVDWQLAKSLSKNICADYPHKSHLQQLLGKIYEDIEPTLPENEYLKFITLADEVKESKPQIDQFFRQNQQLSGLLYRKTISKPQENGSRQNHYSMGFRSSEYGNPRLESQLSNDFLSASFACITTNTDFFALPRLMLLQESAMRKYISQNAPSSASLKRDLKQHCIEVKIDKLSAHLNSLKDIPSAQHLSKLRERVREIINLDNKPKSAGQCELFSSFESTPQSKPKPEEEPPTSPFPHPGQLELF